MANLIASNFLYFLSSNYDNENKNSLISIITDFYKPEELISAKQILIDECDKLGISDSITEFKKRRQLSKGDGIQKVIKDLVDIWAIIDLQSGGKTISTFVIDDPTRLPAIDNNTCNFQHLFSLFSHLQKQVTDIGNIVTRIDKKTDITPFSPLNTSRGNSQSTSPRTLPWSPAKENVSLKRKLNLSATLFVPSKHRRENAPPVVSATTTTTTITTLSSAASAASLPVLSLEELCSSSSSPSPALVPSSTISAPISASLPFSSSALVPSSTSVLTPTSLSPFSVSQSLDLTPTPSLISTTTSLLASLPVSSSRNTAPTLDPQSHSPATPLESLPVLLPASSSVEVLSQPLPQSSDTTSPLSTASSSTSSVSQDSTSTSNSLSSTKEVIEAALKVAKEVAESSRSITDLITCPLPPPPPTPPPHHRSFVPLSPLFAPPLSFSDKVEKLGKNGGQWKTKTSRRGNKSSSIGTNQDAGLKAVPPVSKLFSQFAIYRLEENTSADAVRRHLHKEGIEVVDIWMLGSTIKGTKTAKFRVAKAHEGRAKNPSIWPLHCRIRDWDNGKTQGQRPKRGNSSSAV